MHVPDFKLAIFYLQCSEFSNAWYLAICKALYQAALYDVTSYFIKGCNNSMEFTPRYSPCQKCKGNKNVLSGRVNEMKLNKNTEIFQLTSFQCAGYIIHLVSWLLFLDLIFPFFAQHETDAERPNRRRDTPQRKANEHWRINNKIAFEKSKSSPLLLSSPF